MDEILNNMLDLINQYSALIIVCTGVITLILLIITITLMVSLKKSNKRYNSLMRGMEGKNIEVVVRCG